MLTEAPAAFLLLAALFATAPPALGQNSNCSIDGPRIDCGWMGIDEQVCESRGCCWAPVSGDVGGPVNDVPWCFHDTSARSTYFVKSSKTTRAGIQAELLLGQSTLANFGADIKSLNLLAVYETPERLHVKITDSDRPRWEVPETLLPRPSPKTVPRETLFNLTYTRKPFGFAVARAEDGEVLFNTSGHSMFFKDQFLGLTSAIPDSAALYGIGERTRPSGMRLKQGSISTLWNRDIPAANGNLNLYGSHPFYLDIREGGKAHGVLLLNSNGMDVLLKKSEIEYRVVGGVLDFYFFMGPTPKDVIQQYQELIGRPMMPPLWSLGFHQCRYGYKNVDELQSVVDGYIQADIPLDVMWNDIDYMDGYRDFSLDQLNYALPRMKAFLRQLHEGGRRWVPILDPGIKVDPGYPAYDEGLEKDVFLKDANGERYVGKVWPGAVHFPDWLNPVVKDYWTSQLKYFHDGLVPFDGIWIDMNEASNFCGAWEAHHNVTSGGFGRRGLKAAQACSGQMSMDSNLEHPPYSINNGGNSAAPLSDRCIPVSMQHFDGTTEYNAHNLYGFSQAIITTAAVQSVTGSRPFVLSRSTFPGAGAYVAHWSGDNNADWNNLKWSIVSILNANLFGIPMTGADICGFFSQTTEELCARWISVGAFYPFTRSHSDHAPQELYLWPKVAAAARKALGMRMKLLPYLYTAYKTVHDEGGMVASPLWMEYPEDANTYDIDRQFFFGPALLVSPVLDEGQNQVEAYFPHGTWYNLWDNTSQIHGPGTVKLNAPIGDIPVHVKAGSIIPTQRPALTTADVRTSPITLIVALSSVSESTDRRDSVVDQHAQGSLYMDDGETWSVGGPDSFTVDFKATASGGKGRLTASKIPESNGGDDIPELEAVDVLGFRCTDVGSQGYPKMMTSVNVRVGGLPHPAGSVSYDAGKGLLHVAVAGHRLRNGVSLEWGCQQHYPIT